MSKEEERSIMLFEDCQVVTPSTGNDVSPYLFSLDRIEKSNCLVCQSEYRQYIEELYDGQVKKNYSAIQSNLKDKFDFKISRHALRNHLIRHYKIAHNNAALQDYAEEINKWVRNQHNKTASLKARLAVLEREYFSIAEASDDLDLYERRKNAEVLKKLAETMLVYESKLLDISEEMSPVNVLFEQLTVIVNDELGSTDNSTSKKVVSRILDRLKANCGSMLTE